MHLRVIFLHEGLKKGELGVSYFWQFLNAKQKALKIQSFQKNHVSYT